MSYVAADTVRLDELGLVFTSVQLAPPAKVVAALSKYCARVHPFFKAIVWRIIIRAFGDHVIKPTTAVRQNNLCVCCNGFLYGHPSLG